MNWQTSILLRNFSTNLWDKISCFDFALECMHFRFWNVNIKPNLVFVVLDWILVLVLKGGFEEKTSSEPLHFNFFFLNLRFKSLKIAAIWRRKRFTSITEIVITQLLFFHFQVHEYLRSKLCSLYENDCIFDKFECCWNGNDTAIMTGSYNNFFRMFDRQSRQEVTYEASKEIAKPKTILKPRKVSFDF